MRMAPCDENWLPAIRLDSPTQRNTVFRHTTPRFWELIPLHEPAQESIAPSTTAEHIVGSIVPSFLRLPQDSVRPLPLASLPELPRDGSMLYRIAAVDLRGRVADTAVVQTLGWSARERVRFGAWQGAIACQRSDAGPSVLTKRNHIPIPYALRRLCGIVTGDRVLLAAAPSLNVLVIYPMTALDQMVLGYHEVLTSKEQS